APAKCGFVSLVRVGRVGGMDVEQARLPAIMWVSKPMTRPDRRACLPIIPHPCGRPGGRAHRAGTRPLPQPTRPAPPDRRPSTAARPTACAERGTGRGGLRGTGWREVVAAIGEWAADAPGQALAALGVRRHPLTGAFRPP